MTQQLCILCNEHLNKYPVNKEHYVPQVLIREFEKLCIPPHYNWALRRNEYRSAAVEDVSVPLTEHKRWAVVMVHEKCNLEASAMCRDLRYIIDHLDERIEHKYVIRPLEYYAKIWHVELDSMEFYIHSEDSAKKRLANPMMLLYRPGLLDCGRIVIKSNQETSSDYELHTIYIGKQEAFE